MKYSVGNFSFLKFAAVLDFTPTWALMVDWNITIDNFAAVKDELCANLSIDNRICYNDNMLMVC